MRKGGHEEEEEGEVLLPLDGGLSEKHSSWPKQRGAIDNGRYLQLFYDFYAMTSMPYLLKCSEIHRILAEGSGNMEIRSPASL